MNPWDSKAGEDQQQYEDLQRSVRQSERDSDVVVLAAVYAAWAFVLIGLLGGWL